jgi:hypothetical protein
MARVNTRIEIPRSPEDQIKLGNGIADEDARLGAESPLIKLDWETAAKPGGILHKALALQADVDKYSALAEQAYQARDLAAKDLEKLIRRSRDILKGIHADGLKQLTVYGFDVSSSPKRKPALDENGNPIPKAPRSRRNRGTAPTAQTNGADATGTAALNN